MLKVRQRKRFLKRLLLIIAAVLLFSRAVLFNPNPSNLNSGFDLILMPFISASISPFLVVFVISSSSNFLARDTIRKTWANGKLKTDMGWVAVFVLGKPSDEETQRRIQEEAIENNNILQGDFIDNKKTLLLKTLMLIRWATNAGFDFILKTDDDMYVHIPRLTTWLYNFQRNSTGWLYAGRTRENGIVSRFRFEPYSVAYEEFSLTEYPNYCHGGFYLLSRTVLPELLEAQEKHRLFPVEDAYMGVLARDIGMTPTNIYPRYLMLERRQFHWTDVDYAECKLSEVFGFGDNIDPHAMLHIHNSLQKLANERQSGRSRCKNN